jgi:hypothetical protein
MLGLTSTPLRFVTVSFATKLLTYYRALDLDAKSPCQTLAKCRRRALVERQRRTPAALTIYLLCTSLSSCCSLLCSSSASYSEHISGVQQIGLHHHHAHTLAASGFKSATVLSYQHLQQQPASNHGTRIMVPWCYLVA